MQAWENFLKTQEKELGTETVERWLKSLKVTKFDAGNLYLEAKDPFQAMWFEEHVRKKVQQSFVNNNNKKIKVHISVAGASATTPKAKAKRKKQKESSLLPTFNLSFDELDPSCSFEHFVVTGGNVLPYKLFCKMVNYDPNSKQFIPSAMDLAAFNPIYLYGGDGVGKTHLLTAVTHALKSQGLNVIYTRAETFTEHVVSAIRAGEMSLFREAYRNIDALLIDDVHVFSRKGATQEEFFHTFNTLHLGEKQIILCANCAPSELQFVEPRLVSRFEWGIVLPMTAPNEGDRKHILDKKAAVLNFALHPSVRDFLIETFSRGTKPLIRALEALVLRTHLNHKPGKQQPPVTVTLAKQYLSDLIEEEEQHALTPTGIVQAVAEHFSIKLEDILSKSQNRDCVFPRQIAMYLCRTQMKMPFTKIGQFFSRDHSTVMSSVKRIQSDLDDNDFELRDTVSTILKTL